MMNSSRLRYNQESSFKKLKVCKFEANLQLIALFNERKPQIEKILNNFDNIESIIKMDGMIKRLFIDGLEILLGKIDLFLERASSFDFDVYPLLFCVLFKINTNGFYKFFTFNDFEQELKKIFASLEFLIFRNLNVNVVQYEQKIVPFKLVFFFYIIFQAIEIKGNDENDDYLETLENLIIFNLKLLHTNTSIKTHNTQENGKKLVQNTEDRKVFELAVLILKAYERYKS